MQSVDYYKESGKKVVTVSTNMKTGNMYLNVHSKSI